MNRQEAIQRIVWSLLAHAEAPRQAVAAALPAKPLLGDRAEGDFRNLLRAAGLFARDDDGFFMRYVPARVSAQAADDLPSLPSPTHLLTVPVPVEPRIRIAYSVFTGLVLKHVYQCHAAVPLQVTEGMALLWAPERPAAPASPLPDNAAQVWQEFQSSQLAEDALQDGIEAALSAVGSIGAIAVTDSLARGALFRVLLDILPRHERDFQTQGGMRLDYYSREDIQAWSRALGVSGDGKQKVESLWAQGLNGSEANDTANNIAKVLVAEAFGAARPMGFRHVGGLWRGEGSGKSRRAGKRDEVHRPEGDKNSSDKAERIGRGVEEALRKLDRLQRGTADLDRWVARGFTKNDEYRLLISALASQIAPVKPASRGKQSIRVVSADNLVDAMSDSLRKEALVAFLAKEEGKSLREVKDALLRACKNVVAWILAKQTNRDDIAIFGWPVTILRSVPEEKRFALRFIKKDNPPKARAFLRVPPLGDISTISSPDTVSPVPFTLASLLQLTAPATDSGLPVTSGTRCIVCGSTADLLKGAISFLPESLKRWYESPGSGKKEPDLCSNCAFVAYLSAIYPNSDTSVVEFPADNFLEFFALHEHFQGVSGAVALKTLNRVGALSILPSRFLLLSKNSRQGRMDSKTQVYVQLRHHVPLLRTLDRPMRVQIEGSQPNFWSEIHPHVAIGLSHFARMPNYYETKEGKILGRRVTRSLADGRPFAALYLATETERQRQEAKRPIRERDVVNKGVRAFENEFVRNDVYARSLAQALGGKAMSPDVYEDVIEFSNYLLDIVRPLVQREVDSSGSAVSGISRKYTELITRDFGQCKAARFLYVVAQEADSAERDGTSWAKWQSLQKLYGESPAVKGKSGEEAAKAWGEFRERHTETILEVKIKNLHAKHGRDAGLWAKFLDEVQARTLALLLLNVRNVSTR